jgi:hypothetical protein
MMKRICMIFLNLFINFISLYAQYIHKSNPATTRANAEKMCVERGYPRIRGLVVKCMPSGLICASFRELLQVPRAPVKSPPPHHALSRSRLTGCSHASDQSTVTNMSIVRGNENLEIDREGFIGT